MSKKFVLGVTSALVFIISMTVFSQSAWSSAGNGSDNDVQSFTLLSKSLQSGDNIGPAGPKVGSAFTFSDTLYQSGKKVGMDGGTCTIVLLAQASSTAQCVVTASLPKGQITVQGFSTSPNNNSLQPPFTLAITGGTGAYQAAGGQVTVTNLPNGDSRIAVRVVEEH